MSENKKTIEEQLKEKLKSKKDKLSENSLKAYISTLKNLYMKVYPKEDFKIENFENENIFLKHLKDVPNNKRKTILASLINVCSDDKCLKYREQMLKDSEKYNNDIKKNEKTDTQKNNSITKEELEKVIKEKEEDYNYFLKTKDPNMDILQKAQNYIILLLTSGMLIPPRRSLDYVAMLHKNYKENEDNIYDKKYFIFNKYKTKNKLGQQRILVPKELKTVLNNWIKKIPENINTILFDSNNKPLSAVTLNQRLGRIFKGKRVGVNGLRHLFISEKYNIPALEQIQNTAEQMGQSSILTHLQYIKK